MTKQELTKIIDDMRQSLAKEPGQFHMTAQVVNIGMKSSAQDGGIGTVVTAHGGGPGSSVVGVHATATSGNADVKLVQGIADQEMKKQLDWLVKTLNEIAGELNAQHPDEAKVRGLYKSLVGTWVPGVITSVIGNLLTMTGVALTT